MSSLGTQEAAVLAVIALLIVTPPLRQLARRALGEGGAPSAYPANPAYWLFVLVAVSYVIFTAARAVR